jgi:NAD(P)-dependent dehydrogenase (short-subunit alcohol dehydrogenase family)
VRIDNASAVVTGGASGLGLATATQIRAAGARVVIVDLPSSAGADVAARLGATFVPADVRDSVALGQAFDEAVALAPLRVLVHCAGRGGPVRVLDRDGEPGSFETFQEVVGINLFGTFNALRLGAARMARGEPADGERGSACSPPRSPPTRGRSARSRTPRPRPASSA